MAAKADIVVDQGTTFSTNIQLNQPNGDPIDLTGYTFYSEFKQWYTSSNSVSFNVNVPSPTSGSLTLELTPMMTVNSYPGRYVYDVTMIDAANNVTRVVEGILTLTPAVTFLANNIYSEL